MRSEYGPVKIALVGGAGQEPYQNGRVNVRQDENGRHYMYVSGIAINDPFQAVDSFNAYNDRIFVMAVPFIVGYNPDYSGLDFREAGATRQLAGITTLITEQC